MKIIRSVCSSSTKKIWMRLILRKRVLVFDFWQKVKLDSEKKNEVDMRIRIEDVNFSQKSRK